MTIDQTAPAQQGNFAEATNSMITTESEAAAGGSPSAESLEEIPHARGPPVVGVEDMGLQDGKGVEMSLGEEDQHTSTSVDAPSSTPGDMEISQGNDESAAIDNDGDIVLGDTKPQEGAVTTEETTEATLQHDEEKSDLTNVSTALEPGKED